jgi:cytochrome c oxidase subunit 4
MAFVPLGLYNLPLALTIAGAKALLIAIMFMELRLAKSFIRLAAAAAFVWIAIMFALTFSDLAWRAG